MNDTRMRIHDRKKTSIGDQSEGCRTEETKRDTKEAPFLTAQQKGYQINRKNQDRLKSNPYCGFLTDCWYVKLIIRLHWNQKKKLIEYNFSKS